MALRTCGRGHLSIVVCCDPSKYMRLFKETFSMIHRRVNVYIQRDIFPIWHKIDSPTVAERLCVLDHKES